MLGNALDHCKPVNEVPSPGHHQPEEKPVEVAAMVHDDDGVVLELMSVHPKHPQTDAKVKFWYHQYEEGKRMVTKASKLTQASMLITTIYLFHIETMFRKETEEKCFRSGIFEQLLKIRIAS